MKQREVQGATRESLLLEYAPSKRGGPPDRLFVPTDQLDQVTRYGGGDMPRPDRLRGAGWAKRTGRGREGPRQSAPALNKTDPPRGAPPGHALAGHTPWAPRA